MLKKSTFILCLLSLSSTGYIKAMDNGNCCGWMVAFATAVVANKEIGKREEAIHERNEIIGELQAETKALRNQLGRAGIRTTIPTTNINTGLRQRGQRRDGTDNNY